MNTNPQPHYTLQEAAREIGMGERAVFRTLRRRRVLSKSNTPGARYKRAGYFVERERVFNHPTVGAKPYSQTLVTGPGLEWLRTLLAEECGTTDARTRALIQEVAHMNPDAGEIGPGKLRHLVTQARQIIASSEAAQ